MKEWEAVVQVRRLVPIRQLDSDDRADRPWGRHRFFLEQEEAPTEDQVLDLFHGTTAIANLEQFLVEVVSIRPRIDPKTGEPRTPIPPKQPGGTPDYLDYP